MLQIANKFEVGQEVYIIEERVKSVRLEKRCPICEGVGKIVYKGQELRCPSCDNGVITANIDRVSLFSVGYRGKITLIRLQYVNDESYSVKYKICGKYIPECRLALTEEEAIVKCNNLNSKATEEE